ncbi:MAG: riboflavin synthase [Myxococcota bacterium]|jgi:riboflavin synthase
MFTGLIEDVGVVAGLTRSSRSARLTIRTQIALKDVNEGDSIAVNGVCLTALDLGAGTFTADVSDETLQRSSLGGLRPGAAVNLERALRVGDRLGGHMVQGHVDGVGKLVSRVEVGTAWDIGFEIPEALMPTVIEKGSIALDGISLTVATLEGTKVTVAVIAHTGAKTTLLALPVGSPINVETDVIGKYVVRAVSLMGADAKTGLTVGKLAALGFA